MFQVLESPSRRLCHWCVWVHLSAVDREAAYLLSKRREDAHLDGSCVRGVWSQKMSHQTGINGRRIFFELLPQAVAHAQRLNCSFSSVIVSIAGLFFFFYLSINLFIYFIYFYCLFIFALLKSEFKLWQQAVSNRMQILSQPSNHVDFQPMFKWCRVEISCLVAFIFLITIFSMSSHFCIVL